ncbi:MAG: sugar-binding protein [Armatimonadota bacterium]
MSNRVLAAAAAILLVTAFAAADGPLTTALETTHPPVIDGVADDPCWLNRSPEDSFVRLKTGEPAASQTRFMAARDDANLYLFIACAEPNPDELKMNFTDHDDALWANDCVEIFLDPTNTRQEYAHIIVNPAGAIHDAWVVQGGLSHDATWESGAWVSCQVNQWNWTAEIAVPVGALKLAAGGSDIWGFNVAREKKTDPGELSAWAFTGRGFHDASRFGELSDMDLNYSRFMISTFRPALEKVRFDSAAARSLSGVLTIPTSVSGREARILQVRVTLQQAGQTRVDVAHRTETIPAGPSTLQVPIRLDEPGKYTCTLRLVDPETGTWVHMKQFDLDLDISPMEVTLTKPWYRNSIYSSCPVNEIVADVELLLEGEQWHEQAMDVTLTGPSGAAVFHAQQHFSSQGTSVVAVPVHEISDGTCTLTISADIHGEILSRSLQIHKLPPADHEVCLDEDGQVLVDGEPFFPWGFMGAGPDERLAEAGYNLIHTYVARYSHRNDELMPWLDKCHELGLQVVMYPYPGKVGFHGYKGTPEFTDEDVAEIRAFVKKYKDHPALFGWYMCDEPRGQQWRDSLTRIADVVREVDPYHPTIALDNGANGLLGLQEIGDILWIDPYPGFGVKTGPHVPMGQKVVLALQDVFRGLEDTSKPLWIAPQAFSYAGDDPEKQKVERAPTYLEERSMTYMALVHYVDGVVYYAWAYAKRFPELRVGLLHGLSNEMQVLMPALLGGEDVGAETMCDPMDAIIHTRALRHEGNLYVIATNITPIECIGYVRAEALSGEYQVLSEGRTIGVSDDGTINDHFDGYATHIYTDRTDLPQMKTLEEIAAMIAGAKEAGTEQ